MAPHVLLHELELPHEVEWINLRRGDGQKPDYLRVNPLGAVPVLEMDNGEYLTEVQVILQYLADLVPAKELAQPAGTPERYRLQQWLSLISTELHKSFYPQFFSRRIHADAAAADEMAAHFRKRLEQRWQVVSDRLGDEPWVMGTHFSVADIYLFVVLVWWTKGLGHTLAKWPHLEDFFTRMQARPSVLAVQEKETAATV